MHQHQAQIVQSYLPCGALMYPTPTDLDPRVSALKRHLDRFSPFCRAQQFLLSKTSTAWILTKICNLDFWARARASLLTLPGAYSVPADH